MRCNTDYCRITFQTTNSVYNDLVSLLVLPVKTFSLLVKVS